MNGLSSFGASGWAASFGGLPMADGASNAPRRPQAERLVSESAMKMNASVRAILIPKLAVVGVNIDENLRTEHPQALAIRFFQ